MAKRGPKPKSAFYHARWSKLQIGEQKAAEVLGVSVEQVKLWDKEGNDLATRFLLLWDSRTVRVPGWEGFTFSRGLLKYKNRLQWLPESLIAERMALNNMETIFASSVIDLKTSFQWLIK